MTALEFFTRISQSKEGQEYLKLVNTAKTRQIDETAYLEKHHIHPKALGGALYSSKNLVKLTPYEHCLCHLFLAKAIPCSRTLKPIQRMSQQQFSRMSDIEKITLEEVYKWSKLREQAIHCPHSEEHCKAISNSRKGQKCNGIGTVWMSKEGTNRRVQKDFADNYIREGWSRGRTPESCYNISQARKGQPSPRKGSTCSEEQKAKMSKAHQNKVWVTNGQKSLQISREALDKYVEEGWRRGRYFMKS